MFWKTRSKAGISLTFNMLSGIINVNKPGGFTSHQIVSRLRKILGIKQVGHTGTLDPLAVGVLPVCTGKATRIIEYLDTSKAYRAYILLGVKTDTYDTEGRVLQKSPVKPDPEKINEYLDGFLGTIKQIPPMYSAVHYKGKRLYEYARKNIEIEDIPAREVIINAIELVEIQNPDAENPVLVVDIDCSGGTYIRSIAHDLGEKLGYGCCLENLIRTRSGKFYLEDSLSLEQIEGYAQKGEVEKFLIHPGKVLDFEVIEIDREQKDRIKNGQSLVTAAHHEEKLIQLVFEDNLAAIAEVKEDKIKPVKVFC